MLSYLKRKFFEKVNQEVGRRMDNFHREREEERKKLELMTFPVGSMVICRSNEWENLVIGEVIDHITNGSTFPVVRDLITGEDVFCLGIVRHFSHDLLRVLTKLNPAEQWLVMSNNAQRIHITAGTDTNKKLLTREEILEKLGLVE